MGNQGTLLRHSVSSCRLVFLHISLYNLYIFIYLYISLLLWSMSFSHCNLPTSDMGLPTWPGTVELMLCKWLVTAGNLGGVQLYIRYIRHSKIIRPSLLRWHNGMFIIIILSSLSCHNHRIGWWEKINRKALYLMVKTRVSCRFSLKPIHWHSYLSSSCSCESRGSLSAARQPRGNLFGDLMESEPSPGSGLQPLSGSHASWRNSSWIYK